MPGLLAPVRPPVHRVPAPLELPDGRFGEASFHVEEVAGLADIEAPRQPARRFQRLLYIESEIDQPGVRLKMNLRLAVGAHAAEQVPEAAFLQRHRRDQRVQRALAGLEA